MAAQLHAVRIGTTTYKAGALRPRPIGDRAGQGRDGKVSRITPDEDGSVYIEFKAEGGGVQDTFQCLPGGAIIWWKAIPKD